VIGLKIKSNAKWKNNTGLEDMKGHLEAHIVSKDTALKDIFGAVTIEQEAKTEFSVKCGTSPKGSYFVFLRGAGNTSQIVGGRLAHRLKYVLEDFKHLKEQMKNSDVKFELDKTRIEINDERLVEKSVRSYLIKRSSLVSLLSMTGAIPVLSTIFLGFDSLLSNEQWYPVIAGFIFWLGVSIIGYRSEPVYALE